jgi:hypothetical protein
LGGVVALAWLCASYAFGVAFMLLNGRALWGTFDDDLERNITAGLETLISAVAALLAWLLWKRHSVIAAWIGVIWVTFEVGMKLFMAPGKGLAISAILLLFSINGTRGATAIRASSLGK